MFIKKILDCSCVFVFVAGVFCFIPGQSFSQSVLDDPGYGLHKRVKKFDESGKTESGLVFSVIDLKKWQFSQKRDAERYRDLVDAVFREKNECDRKIRKLRILYPRTPNYDPFGEKTVQRMTEQAYIVDMSEDPLEMNAALERYRELLFEHLPNLTVIEYALMLSQANPIYGDKIFLKHVRDVLYENVGVPKKARPSKGKTPERAYKIVTYAEETYLLGEIGATIEKSEIYKVGDKFYNVHNVVYEDGYHDQFFFDVTWPIYFYEKTKLLNEQKERFSIPLQ